MNDFSRIGYVHIPKTAGRTIRNTLGPVGLWLPPKPRNRTRRPANVHFRVDQLPKDRYDIFFSTVRDPLDWLISYYFYAGFHADRFKTDHLVFRYKTFDEFIQRNGFLSLITRYTILTQSQWVEGIPIYNLLRVNKLQEDLDDFCDTYNLVKVKLKTTGVNSRRNRSFKPSLETIEIVKNIFREDYNLLEEINSVKSMKNVLEIVYD